LIESFFLQDGGDGGSGGGKKKKTAPVPNDGGAEKGWWTFLPWKEVLVAVVLAGVAAWMTLVLLKREQNYDRFDEPGKEAHYKEVE
jgi:hypothetical protein